MRQQEIVRQVGRDGGTQRQYSCGLIANAWHVQITSVRPISTKPAGVRSYMTAMGSGAEKRSVLARPSADTDSSTGEKRPTAPPNASAVPPAHTHTLAQPKGEGPPREKNVTLWDEQDHYSAPHSRNKGLWSAALTRGGKKTGHELATKQGRREGDPPAAAEPSSSMCGVAPAASRSARLAADEPQPWSSEVQKRHQQAGPGSVGTSLNGSPPNPQQRPPAQWGGNVLQ